MTERVLFLCTGNSARSQMAEGLLRHLAGDRFVVMSAGTRPSTVNPLAIDVMRDSGIDITLHRSKALSQFIDQDFAYVITVCDNARDQCPVFPGAATQLHWSFEDPAAIVGSEAQRRVSFEAIRDQIRGRIEMWLETQRGSKTTDPA